MAELDGITASAKMAVEIFLCLARFCYFRDNFVFLACNCKFANLILYNMQCIPCNKYCTSCPRITVFDPKRKHCFSLSFEMIIKFHQAHKTHRSILKTFWKNPANIWRTSGEHPENIKRTSTEYLEKSKNICDHLKTSVNI